METDQMAAHAVALLLSVSFRTLPIVAAVGMACFRLRHASAASRHLVWAVMLISLLVMPIFCTVLPPLTAPVLPVAVTPHRLFFEPTPPTASVDAFAASEPHTVRTIVEDDHTSSDSALPNDPEQPVVLDAGGAISPHHVSVPPAVTVEIGRSSTARTGTAAQWLCLIWLIGFVFILSRIMVGLLGAGRLVFRSRPLTVGPVVEATQAACHKMGLRTPLSVREGGLAAPIAVPMTFGVLRPVILLPAGNDDWSAERLRVVLLHEAAHIKRMDWITALLGQMTLALYWFHPFVWLALRRLRVEAESACDDLVLTHGVAATDYAEQLLDVVRGMTPRRIPSAVVTMAYSHEIKARLRTILAEHRNRDDLTLRYRVLAVIIAIGFAIPDAAVHPVAADTSPDVEKPLHQGQFIPEPVVTVSSSKRDMLEKSLRAQIMDKQKALQSIARQSIADSTPATRRFSQQRQQIMDRYYIYFDQVRSAQMKSTLHPAERAHWEQVAQHGLKMMAEIKQEYRHLQPPNQDAAQIKRYLQDNNVVIQLEHDLVHLQSERVMLKIQDTRNSSRQSATSSDGIPAPALRLQPIPTSYQRAVNPLLPNSIGRPAGDTGAVLPLRIVSALASDAPWKRTLSDGTQVKMMSVTSLDAQYSPIQTWKPDGTPLDARTTSQVATTAPAHLSYEFLVVCPSVSQMMGACVAFGRVGDGAIPEIVPPWYRQRWAVLNDPESMPMLQETIALQVNIATGPETTLISGSPLTGAVRRLPTGEMVILSKAILHSPGEAHQDGHPVDTTEVDFTLPTRFVHNISEYNFVMIGQDGKPLAAQHAGGGLPIVSGRTAQMRYDFRTAEVPLARIREFRLTYRPSQAAVFRGVALRPVAQAAPMSAQ